jgi:adenine-specific DNA-methyltransferase
MIIIMETEIINNIRQDGIFYTPTILADYLVKPVIKRTDLLIFDPACGEGSLLHAAKERCKQIAKGKEKGPKLYGCDKNNDGIIPKGLTKSRFFHSNFLELLLNKKFDVILMNPPYVRHQLIDKEEREQYRKKIPEIRKLKRTADLWVYFLMESVNHLKLGGSIGAILPWSFLQADYGREVRTWLLTKFAKIKLLALSGNYFENAQERIVLLWLEDYGDKATSLKISFSDKVCKRVKFYELNEKQWKAPKVIFSEKNSVESLLDRYVNEFGFSRFREYGSIKIGIVTGADRFFIIDRNSAYNLGFKEKEITPIIKTSREFAGLCMNGYNPINVLISFPKNCSEDHKKYIKNGEDKDLHLRSHSLRRKPWYDVNIGKTPDAFYAYRALRTPYLVFNDIGIQCTNSVHRVYFNKLTRAEKEWIQISLLSAVGQLSLEAYSKSYGRGILKIEPSSLKNALIKKYEKRIPRKIYNDISLLLKKKDKEKAFRLATEFINENLSIPKDLSDSTLQALEELQDRRLSRVS